ncbi:MAG: hypothetical protein RSB59_05960 [Clostridia bacterium]
MQVDENKKCGEFVASDTERMSGADICNGLETNDVYAENLRVDEDNHLSKSTYDDKKKKKKKKFNPIFGIMAAVVATVVIVAVLPKKAPKIVLNDSIVGGDYYAYNITVENNDDIDLKLSIYNDYFKKECAVKSGEIKGVVEGLKPDTSYKLSLKGSQGFGEKTFFSLDFRTKDDEIKFKPSISLDFFDKEGEVGMFFKATINDFLGYYNNYRVFVNLRGYELEVPIVGDITEEQYLPPYGLDFKEYLLFVTADTTDPNDIANNETNITVYSATIRE